MISSFSQITRFLRLYQEFYFSLISLTSFYLISLDNQIPINVKAFSFEVAAIENMTAHSYRSPLTGSLAPAKAPLKCIFSSSPLWLNAAVTLYPGIWCLCIFNSNLHISVVWVNNLTDNDCTSINQSIKKYSFSGWKDWELSHGVGSRWGLIFAASE